ncbi:hypothetical protein O3M35_008278 [Rhynocoris fuscipes]|uniref:Uncharacterized protein n=1 Tax=Rhynocoris fuscipes TaxID=488301 RepID=A0AAW1DBH2_9HEMI
MSVTNIGLKNYYRYSDATFNIRYNLATDYIQISSQSNHHCCQQNMSKLQILFPPYLKNSFCQFKNLLHSFLTLLNVDVITYWASSAKQGCNFT